MRLPTTLAVLCFALLPACRPVPQSGTVQDEARAAGRTAASFPHAGEDYFHDMDGAIALTPDEIKGRNMWLVWTGGNDRFWNQMTQYTFGAFDLLKSISSHPSLGFSRADRWTYLGLVNEPCFQNPTGPDPARHGLWLDVRGKDCAPDPFEDASHYPGVAIGSRGKPLGDGTTERRFTPTAVSTALHFADIAVGAALADEGSTCALDAAGSALCWGVNSFGQVGDGTTTPRLTPTSVTGGLAFKQISGGRLFFIGLSASGAAYGWGSNSGGTGGAGALGTGEPLFSAVPVRALFP